MNFGARPAARGPAAAARHRQAPGAERAVSAARGRRGGARPWERRAAGSQRPRRTPPPPAGARGPPPAPARCSPPERAAKSIPSTPAVGTLSDQGQLGRQPLPMRHLTVDEDRVIGPPPLSPRTHWVPGPHCTGQIAQKWPIQPANGQPFLVKWHKNFAAVYPLLPACWRALSVGPQPSRQPTVGHSEPPPATAPFKGAPMSAAPPRRPIAGAPRGWRQKRRGAHRTSP